MMRQNNYKDLAMRDIKNWRREVQNKEKWRKTINKEVKSTTRVARRSEK
jgi:hypothetical protein